jgi:hypothetical protein
MTPTNKLRFVEREKVTVDLFCNASYQKIRILQQWWEDRNITLSIHIEDKDGNPLPSPNCGEWRDVPVEVEA